MLVAYSIQNLGNSAIQASKQGTISWERQTSTEEVSNTLMFLNAIRIQCSVKTEVFSLVL